MLQQKKIKLLYAHRRPPFRKYKTAQCNRLLKSSSPAKQKKINKKRKTFATAKSFFPFNISYSGSRNIKAGQKAKRRVLKAADAHTVLYLALNGDGIIQMERDGIFWELGGRFSTVTGSSLSRTTVVNIAGCGWCSRRKGRPTIAMATPFPIDMR